MPNASAPRFRFIAHALRGDGPFRPVVTKAGLNSAVGTLTTASALVRYTREGDDKFAGRNEIAYYTSPLMRASSRFVGYLSAKSPTRETKHEMYKAIVDDVDGKGNSLDVFWSQFMVDLKARGSMLLQVDMPAEMAETQAQQIAERRLPYWISIAPEAVADYQLGDDGKFEFVSYSGTFELPDHERVDCMWTFDREGWDAKDKDGKVLGSGQHMLRQCPVLIVTEAGDFPSFGPFASIADVARRLFNSQSELDEILRSQTFSLLHMQVPDGSSDQQKIDAAKTVGQTVGTANLLVHTGASPGFIAPPDGPAKILADRIKDLKSEIAEIGLDVATVNQQESGLAMRMRFAAVNAELSRFAARMEDLERRAWDLTRRWLKMTAAPVIQWPRDFNLADVEQELRILSEMQAAAMPAPVIAEQQHRIVSVQFGGLEQSKLDEITLAIDERTHEPTRPPVPPQPAPVGAPLN